VTDLLTGSKGFRDLAVPESFVFTTAAIVVSFIPSSHSPSSQSFSFGLAR
jgi:hypothetical protein